MKKVVVELRIYEDGETAPHVLSEEIQLDPQQMQERIETRRAHYERLNKEYADHGVCFRFSPSHAENVDEIWDDVILQHTSRLFRDYMAGKSQGAV